MTKFCENCGTPITDGSLFCSSCGAKLTVAPVAQPANTPDTAPAADIPAAEAPAPETPAVETPAAPETTAAPEAATEAPVAEAPTADAPSEEAPVAPEQPVVLDEPQKTPKKGGKAGVAALIILLVMLVGAIACAAVCAVNYFVDKSDITDTISNYVDVVYLGETDKIDDMIPEVLNEEHSEEMEEINEYYDPEEVAADRSEAMDEEFGADIVIKFEVTEFDPVCGDAKALYLDIIESSGMSVDTDIDKIYRVEYDVTVEGDDGDATYTHKRLALEIDGEWYLYDFATQYFSFIDAYISWLELDELYYDDSAIYY